MTISCDILVVGAGVAGVSAALNAARKGADTLLVEKNTFPGGIPVNAVHKYICGLYPSDLHAKAVTLNGGIAEEICMELEKLSPGTKAIRIGKVYVFPFITKNLLRVFKYLTEKQKGLKFFYETKINSVVTDQSDIKCAIAKQLNDEIKIYPQVVIDCSGDGEVIRLSGANYEISSSDKRQLAGFCFKIKGIKNQSEEISIKVPYYIFRAVTENKLPPYLKYTKYYSGNNDDEGFCLINIPFKNGFEETQDIQNIAVQVHNIISGSIGSFKDSYIAEMSSEIAEREGLRMVGQYMLTKEDVLSAKKFSDGVIKNAWPIELWDQDKGPTYQYIKTGDYYEIPLRCLKSKNINNLFGAGRCISVSREALGSTRVMGACISTGEQAGLAAVNDLSGKNK